MVTSQEYLDTWIQILTTRSIPTGYIKAPSLLWHGYLLILQPWRLLTSAPPNKPAGYAFAAQRELGSSGWGAIWRSRRFFPEGRSTCRPATGRVQQNSRRETDTALKSVRVRKKAWIMWGYVRKRLALCWPQNSWNIKSIQTEPESAAGQLLVNTVRRQCCCQFCRNRIRTWGKTGELFYYKNIWNYQFSSAHSAPFSELKITESTDLKNTDVKFEVWKDKCIAVRKWRSVYWVLRWRWKREWVDNLRVTEWPPPHGDKVNCGDNHL